MGSSLGGALALDVERAPDRPKGRGGLVARGEDLSRILALSEGVFAFAMTLLVINLVVPTSATLDALAPNQGRNGQLLQYLVHEETAFFAYGLAFFIIGTWWSTHHRLFGLLRGYDRPLMSMNLVFLLFIAITPFDVGLLANYGTEPIAVGFYAGAQAIAGLIVLSLWMYVRRGGRPLLRPRVPEDSLRWGERLAMVAPIAFGVSAPVALWSPIASYAIWISIFLVRAILRRTLASSAVNAPD